ncbi:Hypothetical predicted protein [Paramuricea clavata]|uniref:Uncharacterized protein n=1 Tax=Paramuricea clavata TaxID=317549 RepID=A0A6S7FTB9_PARCT|nr:Hypothetical predicted protein [Paramuricea clavata]
MFCYQSIVATLKQFVMRSGFTERCELWRSREIRTGHQIMCDVFEGRIWKDFMTFDDSSFLASPWNYAFMLNVDWMQPFDHTEYSIGVMYLVLMNLPRNERFKRENIFLVGIIPGPNEPCHDINSFLRPLVDELCLLWKDGVQLRHSGSPLFPELFRAALLNPLDHRKHIDDILAQPTQELRNAKESEYGARYMELLRLPYFDCIRFTIVDHMHNLFLGTAKRMMEIWIDLSLLTRADLERIQSKVDTTNVPSNFGRMPYKIATSFSGFTAEQWKTWVTVFSPFALFGHLPSRHYKCWLNFVKACKLLSKPMIQISEVGTAHSLLIKFFLS